ncbi:MAG TPA: hypothetical protein VM939_08970, partial [Gemmatimonadaceae bacterium]|nr:hypothetical protein [Gemmatimonadaceae bacterium]
MARIALDAMGGDFAPRATIAGALQALDEMDGTHTVQLIGQIPVIERQLDESLAGELSGLSPHRERMQMISASDTIEMSEKP